MIRTLKTLVSCSNLSKAKNCGGQISTLLILGMVVALIFVLATVNIGNVALESTKLSNAADSAVLMLASNLSTKARMIFEGLGNKTKKCTKRNILSGIIAIVVAIIAVIFCQVCLAVIAQMMLAYAGAAVAAAAAIAGTTAAAVATAAAAVVVGAAAGAVGGAAGAAVSGTSISQGAWTGFKIGVAIGTAAGPAIVPVNTAVGATVFVPAGLVSITSGVGALGAASGIYMEAVKFQNVKDLQVKLGKELSKLDETDRFRESAFYTALTQLVDDPVMIADNTDMDGDGDSTELLPRFYVFWHERISGYTHSMDVRRPIIDAFIANMVNFRDYISTHTYAGDGNTPGILERREYKWSMEPVTTVDGPDYLETAMPGPNPDWGVVDGNTVRLLRALNYAGYTTPYWGSGPSAASMNACADEDCDPDEGTCSAIPAGYDEIDKMSDNLRSMVTYMDAISLPTFENFLLHMYPPIPSASLAKEEWNTNYNIMHESLKYQYNQALEGQSPATGWENWVYDFYDPYNPSDEDTYYMVLTRDIEALQKIRAALIAMRDSKLPVCNEGNYDYTDPLIPICAACIAGAGHWEWIWIDNGYDLIFVPDCGPCVFNPPCSFRSSASVNQATLTVDTDSADELAPALNDIDALIAEMTNFKNQIKAFADAMFGIVATGLGDCGARCVRYEWEDSRGIVSVQVEAGNFKMPRTKTKSSLTKTCTKMKNYDTNQAGVDNCWIKVTRSEPGVGVGVLGRWNPFKRSVSKVSRADYGINRVGIKAIKKP